MKYRLLILVISALSIFYCGCGRSDELDRYNEEMTDFTQNIVGIKESIESIDTSSDGASDELLLLLDSMKDEFQTLSELEVPQEFAPNESLADEAYEYITQAVAMYHEYYDSEAPDDNTLDAANQNYERALKRIEYISSILQGELPTGEGIEVTEEDAYGITPVTDEAGDINN